MRPIPATDLGHAHGLLRAIDSRGRLRTDEFVTEFSLEELFPANLENALGRLRHFISYARAAGLVKEDRGVVELTDVGRRYIRAGDAEKPFEIGSQQAEWLRRQLREKHMTDSIFHGLAIGLSLLASCPPAARVSTMDFGRSMAYLGRAGWDNDNTLLIQGERHLVLLGQIELIDDEHRLTPTGHQLRGELTLPVHMSLIDIAAQLNPGGADAVREAAEQEWARPVAAPPVQESPTEPAPAQDEDNGRHTVVQGAAPPSDGEPEPRPPIVPRARRPAPPPAVTPGDPLAQSPAIDYTKRRPATPEPSAPPPAEGPPASAPPPVSPPPVAATAGPVESSPPPVSPPPAAASPPVSPPPAEAASAPAREPSPPVASAPPPVSPPPFESSPPRVEPSPPRADPATSTPPPARQAAPPEDATVVAPITTPKRGQAFVDPGAIRAAAEAAGLKLPDGVYANIAAALGAGKHVLLTGAPGSGKTTLALAVTRAAAQAGQAHGATVVTGAPARDRLIEAAGRARWVIADELDQSDPDEALAALTTFLAGIPITIDRQDEVAPAEGWRIVATWNAGKPKAAILRRFAIVEVQPPSADELRRLIQGAAAGDDKAFQAAQRLLEAPVGTGVVLDAARHAAARNAAAPTEEATLAAELYAAYVEPIT